MHKILSISGVSHFLFIMQGGWWICTTGGKACSASFSLWGLSKCGMDCWKNSLIILAGRSNIADWNFVMGVQEVRFDIQLKALVVNIIWGTSFWKYAHNFELWHDVFAYFSALQWYWVFRFFVCCCCYFTFQYHFLTIYLCTDSLKDMFWIDVLQLHIQFKEGVF